MYISKFDGYFECSKLILSLLFYLISLDFKVCWLVTSHLSHGDILSKPGVFEQTYKGLKVDFSHEYEGTLWSEMI